MIAYPKSNTRDFTRFWAEKTEAGIWGLFHVVQYKYLYYNVGKDRTQVLFAGRLDKRAKREHNQKRIIIQTKDDIREEQHHECRT